MRRNLVKAAPMIAPFAGACWLAWAAVLVGSSITWWQYVLSFVLASVAGLLALVTSGSRRHAWLAVVPSALLLLLAVGFLRNSAGGISSGAVALAILPVFQTALYSQSLRDLFIVLVGVALLYLLPVVLVGPPAYPHTQYRAGLLGVAIDGIIGLTTQRLVASVRHQATQARGRERMLKQVNEVVHNLFQSPQPRTDVCEAARAISHASAALLYEPATGTDELVCTALAGIDAQPEKVTVERHSAAYQAFRSGRPTLISRDVEPHIGRADLWVAAGRPTSVLYEPLLVGETRLGVLVIGWSDEVRAEGPRAIVAGLLAHEVAAVIVRSDAMDHLNDEALTDPLTGLPNRRAWEAHLAHSARDGEQLAVAILDLDHFKQFNDTRGHPAGDRLLKETAAAWRDQLRTGDFLARIGGEEFGLLLPHCGAQVAVDVVERLRGGVTQGRTCSAGLAIRRPGEDAATLIAHADQALYQAKAQGRDRVHLNPAPRPASRQSLEPS